MTLDIRSALQWLAAIINTLLALPGWIFDSLFVWTRFVAIGACVCLVGAWSGCSQGTRQWYEKTEPQTKITIDPISKQVTLFDNNGRAVTLEDATITKTADGGLAFTIKGLNITEKSVENRTVSIEQDRTLLEGFATVNKSIIGDGGITGLVQAITPTLSDYIKTHPASAKNPDIMKGVITGLIRDQLVKNIGTPGTPLPIPGM